jgi:hypothetical protein
MFIYFLLSLLFTVMETGADAVSFFCNVISIKSLYTYRSDVMSKRNETLGLYTFLCISYITLHAHPRGNKNAIKILAGSPYNVKEK